MAIDYNKYTDHIFKSEWIYCMVKDVVNGVTGYYIKFYDHSFIFGTVRTSKDGLVFTPSFNRNNMDHNNPMCNKFMDYMDETFEDRLYPAKAMSSIYKKSNSLTKKRKALKAESRSIKDLTVEMIDAANIEDYEVASNIKKIINNKK